MPENVQLDDTDRRLLRVLQRDGRISNLDLAQQCNLSASACSDRVRRLRERGVITGFAAILDPKAIDRALLIFVEVQLDRTTGDTFTEFAHAAQRTPEILECHLLAGAHDYLMRVIYRDSADFERIHTDIITQLPGVTRVQSTLTLRTIKKTSALPV